MADLPTLDDAKQHLDITRTTDDAELMDFLEATTAIVETYIGPLSATTFVEKHPSGDRLVLFHPPVLTVVTVEPWLTAGTGYLAADLVVDAGTGTVQRKDGLTFTGGPFRVTYTAGLLVVPPNVRLAYLMILAHLWKTQRGPSAKLPAGGAADTTPVPGMGYAVPRRALELLHPSKVVVA